MDLGQVTLKIEQMAAPILAAAHVELVELKVFGNPSDLTIQFMADKPEGGITIQECAQLNRAIVEKIDADGFLGEGYSLEFSSPGLDRPLVVPKDFQRRMNMDVDFQLKEAVEGKKAWVGTVIGATNGVVTIMAKKNKQIVIPIDQIIKAALVI